MNEETMRKHYERTPKETLINILISSREQVDKLQKRNKERKQEIERLNKGYCKFKEQCGKYATCLRENQLKEIERLNNIIEKIRDYVYKPVDKEWGDILCIIEDERKRSE